MLRSQMAAKHLHLGILIHRGVGLIGKSKSLIIVIRQGGNGKGIAGYNWPKRLIMGRPPKWRVPWAQLICYIQQLNCLGDIQFN